MPPASAQRSYRRINLGHWVPRAHGLPTFSCFLVGPFSPCVHEIQSFYHVTWLMLTCAAVLLACGRMQGGWRRQLRMHTPPACQTTMGACPRFSKITCAICHRTLMAYCTGAPFCYDCTRQHGFGQCFACQCPRLWDFQH